MQAALIGPDPRTLQYPSCDRRVDALRDPRKRRTRMSTDIPVDGAPLFELDDVHREFQRVCRDFVSSEVLPRTEEAERDGQFPLDLMPKMGRAGFLGLGFPEDAGGTGGDMLAIAIFSEEIARASGGIAVT